jgi:hypothetical protein
MHPTYINFYTTRPVISASGLLYPVIPSSSRSSQQIQFAPCIFSLPPAVVEITRPQPEHRISASLHCSQQSSLVPYVLKLISRWSWDLLPRRKRSANRHFLAPLCTTICLGIYESSFLPLPSCSCSVGTAFFSNLVWFKASFRPKFAQPATKFSPRMQSLSHSELQ